jgi:hypothetical protein
MKKVGSLMKDMGFKVDSNSATQEAFIKYLIKQAYGVEVKTPSEKKQSLNRSPEQLSFKFDEMNFKTKKVS